MSTNAHLVDSPEEESFQFIFKKCPEKYLRKRGPNRIEL